MNTAHTLLQAVGVPGNVVVEKDMATLQVDTFPGGLGGHQNLDGSFPELLFGVKTGAGFIPSAWLHAAMDETDLEAPGFQFFDQIVEGILKFGEEEQALVRIGKEAFLVQQVFELGKFGFGAGVFHDLGLPGQLTELGDLLTHLIGISGQGDGLKHLLETLAFALLHFFELFRVREVRRGLPGEVLGSLQPLGQSLHPILQAVPHGIGA